MPAHHPRASAAPPFAGDRVIAKPNYQYEKRQKELAKKRKKEEKEQRKAVARTPGADDKPEPS